MRQLIAAALSLVSSVALCDGPQDPDPIERRGAALYRQGAHAHALLLDGSLRVPARDFACAGCHGADGAGAREGGTVFPALDWSSLSASSRADGGYDAERFARAVTAGIGPDGRRLSASMPRYEVPPAVLADLVTYLEELAHERRRGITARTIRIDAAPGTPAYAGLVAVAARLNEAGGFFGRRLLVRRTDDALIDADTLSRRLSGSIRRTVERLRRRHLATLDANRLPRAVVQVALGRPVHRPPRDRIVYVVSLAEAHAAAAIRAGVPPEALRGYLDGLLLGDALAHCSRALTRGCVTKTLPRVSVDRYLSVYGPLG